MRKAFSGILAAIIVLSMCTATAFAAGPGCGRNFVDVDRDGVCDNYIPGQGRRGGIFVDADGNGICDNYVPGQCGGCGSQRGCGNGFRGGRGR